jgi:small subunit ribosomal protein S1
MTEDAIPTDDTQPAPPATPVEPPAAEAAPEPGPLAKAQPADAPAAASDSGAVDTGRRIDPSRLQVRGPKGGAQKTRMRDKGQRPPRPVAEGEADAAAAAAPAEGDGEQQKKRRRRRPKRRVVEKDELYEKREPAVRGDDAMPKGMPPRVKHIPVDDTGGKSFAELLAETDAPERQQLGVGDRVEGEVVMVGSDSVFVALGPGLEATLGLAEVMDEEGRPTVSAGDTVQAYVTSLRGGTVVLSKTLGRHGFDPAMLEEAKQSGLPVEGQVTGHNKGGLEVSLLGARGFCPLGQADLGYVEDPAAMVGKTYAFLVTEVKSNGKEIVLSRKALLLKEREEKRQLTLESLRVGDRREGVISRVQPFGAFVDLGGVDGLIPVSELSFGRIDDPSSVVHVGQRVNVEVLKIEPDPKRTHKDGTPELRIGLSLKHALTDPFDQHEDELREGRNLTGRVVRLKPFGAFVELLSPGSGLEGLVHISEITDRRIGTPGEVLSEGDEVTVRVLNVDRAQRRIGLSIKDAELPELMPGETPSAAAQRAGWRRGASVTGMVDRIERYGVFVNVEGLGSALLPASESGVPRGQDLGKALPLGTELELLVIDVDERGRAKVSLTAREREDERALVKSYASDTTSSGGGGLGTFGDLLKAKLNK